MRDHAHLGWIGDHDARTKGERGQTIAVVLPLQRKMAFSQAMTSALKTGRRSPTSSEPAEWAVSTRRPYLTDVRTRIVLHGDVDPIDDLLLYNWVDKSAAASAAIDQPSALPVEMF